MGLDLLESTKTETDDLDEQPPLDSSSIAAEAKRIGFDLVGFVPVASLDGPVDGFHPGGFAPHLKTLIVLVRRSFAGLRRAHHAGTRQFWGGRLLKRIEDDALKLAVWLEEAGAAASPYSSLMVDYASGGHLELTPAGQGSALLLRAAVAAGLGTSGLNGMLLTPEFGPRVYVTAVVTAADAVPGRPLTDELCPGLEECGWCAAVCPAGAIPAEAPAAAALESVRGLDRQACAAESQPLGLDTFRRHLMQIFRQRPDAEAMWEVVGGRTTGALWQEMIMIKEGVFAGCSECVAVCPAGADVAAEELEPPDSLVRHVADGLVRIETQGAA